MYFSDILVAALGLPAAIAAAIAASAAGDGSENLEKRVSNA